MMMMFQELDVSARKSPWVLDGLWHHRWGCRRVWGAGTSPPRAGHLWTHVCRGDWRSWHRVQPLSVASQHQPWSQSSFLEEKIVVLTFQEIPKGKILKIKWVGLRPTHLLRGDKWFRMLMTIPSNLWHFLTMYLSTVCFAFCLHNNYKDLYFIAPVVFARTTLPFLFKGAGILSGTAQNGAFRTAKMKINKAELIWWKRAATFTRHSKANKGFWLFSPRQISTHRLSSSS